MGDLQLNHGQALEMAYKALIALRLEGEETPSLTAISNRSGVARSTIHRPDEDWKTLRRIVQKGLPIPLPYVHLEPEIEGAAVWVRRLDAVEDNFAMLEGEFAGAKDYGEELYGTLLAELRKYVLIATEKPAKKEKEGKTFRENNELRQEIERLKGENASLRLNRGLPADVRALGKKEVITACENMAGSDITLAALDDWEAEVLADLDDYFRQDADAKIPTIVYVMCGNFSAGKSRWIKAHQPLYGGVNLYIDGPGYTTKFRKHLLARIRKLSPKCVVACVRVKATLAECLLRNDNTDRVRSKKNVPPGLIEELDTKFQEASLDEGFDEFLVPRGQYGT